MPPALPLLPPTLPVMLPGAMSDHNNSRAFSGSAASIRSEPSRLLKELSPLPHPPHPSAAATHGPHQLYLHGPSNTRLLRKENRLETRLDAEAMRDQYLTRQQVVHRNLAKLAEVTVHEEVKLPVAELVVRGYYEWFAANLSSIKRERSRTKVPIRERELMLVFMDGVEYIDY